MGLIPSPLTIIHAELHVYYRSLDHMLAVSSFFCVLFVIVFLKMNVLTLTSLDSIVIIHNYNKCFFHFVNSSIFVSIVTFSSRK